MNYPVPAIYDYTLVSRIAPRPIDVDDLIQQLKLDPDLANDTDFVAYVNALIDAAVICGEKFTRRTFQESNFESYLDYFVSSGFGLTTFSRYSACSSAYEIRQSPFQAMTSIEYYSDGTLTAIDSSNYYTTKSLEYASMAPANGYTWPSADNRLQAIEIKFTAGYKEGELPADLKQALLLHVAAMFSNRGDCTFESVTSQVTVTQNLPPMAKSIYQKNRIIDLRMGL